MKNILLCIVQKVVPCIAVNLRFFLLWFTFKEYIPFSFTTLVVYKLSSVNWYCKRCYNYFLHLLMIFVINILEMWRVFVHNRVWKGYTLFSQWNYDLYGIMNTLTSYLLIYLRTIAICPLNINFKWENKLVMAQTVSK